MKGSLALACWLVASLARADDMHSPLGVLVPTAGEHAALHERELESALVPLLEALSGVERAVVRLDLPDAACAPLDEPLPAATASVVLVLAPGAAQPAEGAVRQLVAGSARELATARVSLAYAPGKAEEPLVSVGRLDVPAPSARGLRLALAASLLANVMLATVLILRLRRRPRSARSY
jgi:hypothetical protein